MSFDLTRKDECLRFSVYVWGEILRFAQLHGWQPMGTLPPEDREQWGEGEWSGSYSHNSSQRVDPADALALAAALERGLPDLPDEYAAKHKAIVEETDGEPTTILIPVGAPISPIEALSGPNKTAIRELIAFCRKGSFTIE